MNKEKSAVDRVNKRKFLGFTIYKKPHNGEWSIRVSNKSKVKCRKKIKEITKRNRGVKIGYMIKKINEFLR